MFASARLFERSSVMGNGFATLIGRFTVAEVVEVGVVLVTTAFVAVFVVIALVLPDVAVAATI